MPNPDADAEKVTNVQVSPVMEGDRGVMMRGEDTVFVSQSLKDRIDREGPLTVKVLVIPQVDWTARMQPQLYGDYEETKIKFKTRY